MKKQELVLPYFNLRTNLNDAPQEKKKENIYNCYWLMA
jgi:hypothetical protein